MPSPQPSGAEAAEYSLGVVFKVTGDAGRSPLRPTSSHRAPSLHTDSRGGRLAAFTVSEGLAAASTRFAGESASERHRRAGEVPIVRRSVMASLLSTCHLVPARSRGPFPVVRGTGRWVRSRAQVVRTFHLHDRFACDVSTRFDPGLSTIARRKPLLGLSKYAPPSVSCRESTRCARDVAAARFPDRACQTRSRSVPAVSHRLNGFLLSAAPVCCNRSRPWGSPCFRRQRADFPTTPSRPPKPSSSSAAATADPKADPRGRSSPPARVATHGRSRVSLPPRRSTTPAFAGAAVDLEAFLHTGSGTADRALPLDRGPCSPGLVPRRTRRHRRGPMSPSDRTPVSRCHS